MHLVNPLKFVQFSEGNQLNCYTTQALIAHGLPPLIFVTADDHLIAVTRAEAVAAENLNLHP